MRAPDPIRHGAFISYAREDGEEAARALQARLTDEVPDVPAWLDRFELEGGVGWWNQIEQQLDRAEFLILILTPAALRSENTRREWRSARQRGVCVYPAKGAPDAALDYASLPNWMSKAHFYDLALEWPKLVMHLRRGCRATRVPFMAPTLPGNFVARPKETNALMGLLLDAPKAANPVAITTALRGAGGFGKTTLAAAICHDDRVIDTFDDGILWVTLGQTPNLLNELIKLHAALTGERPGFVDVEDAVRELAFKLENKNCLLVLDDAWTMAHVAPFLRAGLSCARLITTRLFEVVGDARRVDVDQMDPVEAAQLLAPAGVGPDALKMFRRLVVRLGGWPLPTKLAGSVMRQRIARGDSAEKALDYVLRALEKRGITAFDKADASERHDAVARTIGASLDLLTPDEQRRCAELTIFPEDTSISLSVARALWQLDDIDSEDLARKLDEHALLDFDLRTGVLRMHDVLREFLAHRVADPPALHRALIDAWGDPYCLPEPYAWRGYTYHLRRAGREAERRALLLDPRWLDAKLQSTGIHSLIADFESSDGDGALELVRDSLRLSAPSLAVDPRQLRAQLVGRMLEREEPEIVVLRERLQHSMSGPWLRPMRRVLDAPGGMLLMTLVGHEGEVTSLAADGNQRYLLSASEDGTVRVWDRQGGQLSHMLKHRTLGSRSVSLNYDGTIAASGGADGMLYLWDVAGAERIHAFWGERGPALTAVALSGDGRLAVSGSREHGVSAWDVDGRKWLRRLDGHSERVTSVALSADGSRAASGSDDCTVRIWNLSAGTLERTLEGHTSPVNAVALSADGQWVLSGSSDRTLKLWAADTGTCRRTLTGHASSVTSVALALHARRGLSGSTDQTARLWDLDTGEVLATLDGHSDVVTAVAIDDAGVRAATGSVDRTIKLWRLEDLRAAHSPELHGGAVTALVFSPDGRLCASGGDDGRIVIHEVESGHVLRVIDAHAARVRSLAFTEDGACVLSGGVDQKYWLWTVASGDGAWIPVRHLAPVDYCALTASARYLMTSCTDQFVYIWDVPSGALVDKYGTRRLFDHLIVPAARRDDLPDTDEHRDTYLAGEARYDVVIIRMSPDGTHAALSATVRERGAGRNALRAGPPPAGVCLLVLNLRTGEFQSVSAPQVEAVTAFSIDTAKARLLWAKADHVIELWNLRPEARLATMRGHTQKVNAVEFSRDGRRAISCGRDRSARVWNVETGEQLAAYTADAALRSMALAPDDTIAVGDVAGRIHILRLDGMSPQ